MHHRYIYTLEVTAKLPTPLRGIDNNIHWSIIQSLPNQLRPQG